MPRINPDRICIALGNFPGKWSPLILFVLAFWLRTYGLSHDLHHGLVYHPDTPKQIRTVERFLDGHYYDRTGGRDYRGYPYFNSHLVEYLVRAYELAGAAMVRHAGIADGVTRPDYLDLFWITRALNAVLSSLAVLLLTLIGRRYISNAAGVAAGLLLALSPVDITACHFAAGDTTAAFFAFCATAIALCILPGGRMHAYIGAGLLSAAAFSSKYHGGIGLISALVAHLLVFAPGRMLMSKESIGRMALLLISFIAGVFVTSPALLIAPDSAFKDIVGFFQYTASFGMTAEMKAMSLPERIRMGMSLNMPVLVQVTGAIPVALALYGLWKGRRAAATWIIASVPILYILAGLSTKPLTHAVYHTMAMPGIMWLAASGWYRLYGSNAFGRITRIASSALLIAALGYLAHYSRTELFFFKHNDTRYLSRAWAEENLPLSLKLKSSKYTFDTSAWSPAADTANGTAYVFSDRDPVRPPREAARLYSFTLENEKLSVFRNWPQHFFIHAPDYFEPPASRPAFLPLPSMSQQTIIMEDAPWIVRHTGTWLMTGKQNKSGALAAPGELPRAVWLVRAGVDPCEVELDVGGQSRKVRLGAGQSQLIEVEDLKSLGIRRAIKYFYAWHVRVLFGTARISLLTRPHDVGWAQFNAGEYRKALASFDMIPVDQRRPGDVIPSLLCKIILSPGDVRPEHLIPPVSLANDYGIHPDYLRQLPALMLDENHWPRETVAAYRHRDDLSDKIIIPGIPLDPGVYSIELETETDLPGLKLEVTDLHGRLNEHVALRRDDEKSNRWEGLFTVDHADGFAEFRAIFPSNHPPRLTTATIRPDYASTLNSYVDLVNSIISTNHQHQHTSRLAYHLLVALGDALRASGAEEKALVFYSRAMQAAPFRQIARQRAGYPGDESPAYAMHPVNAAFENKAILKSYQIDKTRARSGDEVSMATYWDVPSLGSSIFRHSIYLHGIRLGDKEASFFGDAFLIEGLRMNEDDDHIRPSMIRMKIPADASTGKYEIIVGLWIPPQQRRIHAKTSDLPFDRRGIVLTTIDVVP